MEKINTGGLDIAIQKAVEQARDNNFFEASTTGRGVYPFINLFEKEGDLVLAAELPGIKKGIDFGSQRRRSASGRGAQN